MRIRYLSLKFIVAAEGFPEDAWDCTTETDLTITPSAEGAHSATCQESWEDIKEEDCFQGFIEGNNVKIDSKKQ